MAGLKHLSISPSVADDDELLTPKDEPYNDACFSTSRASGTEVYGWT